MQVALGIVDAQLQVADLQRAERAHRECLVAVLGLRAQIETAQLPLTAIVDQVQIESGQAKFAECAIAFEQRVHIEREFRMRNRHRTLATATRAETHIVELQQRTATDPAAAQMADRDRALQARRKPVLNVLRVILQPWHRELGKPGQHAKRDDPGGDHGLQGKTQPPQARAPRWSHPRLRTTARLQQDDIVLFLRVVLFRLKSDRLADEFFELRNRG